MHIHGLFIPVMSVCILHACHRQKGVEGGGGLRWSGSDTVAPAHGSRSDSVRLHQRSFSPWRTGEAGEKPASAAVPVPGEQWCARGGAEGRMLTHRFRVAARGCRSTLSSVLSESSQPGLLLGKHVLGSSKFCLCVGEKCLQGKL